MLQLEYVWLHPTHLPDPIISLQEQNVLRWFIYAYTCGYLDLESLFCDSAIGVKYYFRIEKKNKLIDLEYRREDS